ncbi:bifunctional 3-demethylubiquinone-9 3-methyltransferase/ 2-octaprenyl-6-hydroxy phenol methylase [Crateriforma conspicua]|uniref:Bifunctional 3-demethylubiquinone-9 3-methyltransferase/ 2-octaprenyl-6-hydroxy phenol methylase n=2 Tax=Crateriforma TaxID=2714592 RepID=A0A5C6FWJ1_9PLAN|nr:class I SAM-dependent methyltransferase [Crateriforma conspicua]TWU66025.1 bifunctional 3-demethylubiquinone-9 3-methyltransferase/ 2-octaprenyl-6-hydroxy phenol methylase [Crateriforma conspicua]
MNDSLFAGTDTTRNWYLRAIQIFRADVMLDSPYRTDLALIHDAGFGHFAAGAARMMVRELQRRGVRDGTVIDVGCGGGIASKIVDDHGYNVLGMDLSESHIQIARRRVPDGEFSVGSYLDQTLASSVAIMAIGEIFNYGFDPRCDRHTFRKFIVGVFQALKPGGLFLFDIAGPDRAPDRPTQTYRDTDDWTVLVETSSNADRLTRRIVTFVREGRRFRRDAETHQLNLFSPTQVVDDLRETGFEVSELDRYSDVEFPVGLHGFLAVKD